MNIPSLHSHWIVPILVLLIQPTTGFTDSFDPTAREGIAHFNREEFDQATAKFQASQLEQPDDENVAYNLANSLYRLGRYEEAVEAYKQALAEKAPPTLKQKSYYNMGNAYYRMGYMEESIEAYKKALELDSGDIDSKFNLEWVRKQREKAQQSGRIDPRDKNILKQPGTSDRPNNPPDPQTKPEESLDSQAENLENHQTANNQSQHKADATDKPHPTRLEEIKEKTKTEEQAVQDALKEMTQMTPEEAERWLGSLSEDLKSITRRQMQGRMKDVFKDHDKDW